MATPRSFSENRSPIHPPPQAKGPLDANPAGGRCQKQSHVGSAEYRCLPKNRKAIKDPTVGEKAQPRLKAMRVMILICRTCFGWLTLILRSSHEISTHPFATINLRYGSYYKGTKRQRQEEDAHCECEDGGTADVIFFGDVRQAWGHD